MMRIPSRQTLEPLFSDLEPAYVEYVETVSRWEHAISLTTASLFLWILDQVEPTSILDLGSGFTSYVSRKYVADTGRDVAVLSVDTDQKWLAKTADFIAHQELPVGEFGLADGVDTDRRFDVIIHDLANGDVREEWMPIAVSMLTDRGVIVFDDMQDRTHHWYACRASHDAGMTLLDAFEATCDPIARFASVAVQ